MTDEQVSEKFRANAQVLGTSGADRIVATVLDLESLDDVRVLTALTVP